MGGRVCARMGGGGGGRGGGIDGQGQDTHCNDITKDTKTEKITKNMY